MIYVNIISSLCCDRNYENRFIFPSGGISHRKVRSSVFHFISHVNFPCLAPDRHIDCVYRNGSLCTRADRKLNTFRKIRGQRENARLRKRKSHRETGEQDGKFVRRFYPFQPSPFQTGYLHWLQCSRSLQQGLHTR